MDYAATAILAGPIPQSVSDAILHTLRDYRATLTTTSQADRVELAFTIRGGSDREAVIRAMSVCDDLGPRLVFLRVLPA